MCLNRLGRTQCQQQGATLIIMLIIMVMGIATALVSSLSSTALKNTRQQTNSATLSQAKEALIAYAVTYGDSHSGKTHGYLPCPDLNTSVNPEGSSEPCGSQDVNTLGKLPWKTLGMPAQHDGNGECLWYAVSGTYKNNPATAQTMNWDSTGKLRIFSSSGNEILANEIVAVVIAPGATLSNQNRSSIAGTPVCGGNYLPENYLDNDTEHNINNADITTGQFILPHDHQDSNGNTSVSINDQFVYITRQDIWSSIQKRVAQAAKQCLDDYANSSSGKYPWAAPVDTATDFNPFITGQFQTRFGRLSPLPSSQTEATPAAIISMQQQFTELWIALANFYANQTAANRSTMRTKADAAKNAAESVKGTYEDTSLKNPARSLKNAADNAKSLSTSSSTTEITNAQQQLTVAANEFVAQLNTFLQRDNNMSNTWPISCTIFSSPEWDHWKNSIFHQISESFEPNGSTNCGNCLSIEHDGQAMTGSGTYHATLVIAGKNLTNHTRSPSNISDYLEDGNLLPQNDPAQTYKTYRVTDANYPTVNDLVLCLNGTASCP